MKLKQGATDKVVSIRNAQQICDAVKNKAFVAVSHDVETSAQHIALMNTLAKQTRPYAVVVITPKG